MRNRIFPVFQGKDGGTERSMNLCNIHIYFIVLVSVQYRRILHKCGNIVSDEYNFSYCMETSAISYSILPQALTHKCIIMCLQLIRHGHIHIET